MTLLIGIVASIFTAVVLPSFILTSCGNKKLATNKNFAVAVKEAR
jgi:preprotein translocase subunit SecD